MSDTHLIINDIYEMSHHWVVGIQQVNEHELTINKSKSIDVCTQVAKSSVQVSVEEGRRSSLVRPLLCGIMVALLVLGIGIAVWALVGIDRRGQQLARSGNTLTV